MNLELLKKRKRELCGSSMTIDMRDNTEEMAITLSLTLKGKSVTHKDVLVRRMEDKLDEMSSNDVLKPFCEAVLEIYRKLV